MDIRGFLGTNIVRFILPGAAIPSRHDTLTRAASGGLVREAHLPAQQPETVEEARFPESYEDARGSRDSQGASAQGPVAALGLIRRLRGRSTFAVLAQERPVRAGALWMRAADLGVDEPPAVGFSITRRGRTGVARNRLRRRIQGAVRQHADLLRPGHAYLFGIGARTEDITWEQLEGWTEQLLRRQPK